MKTKSKVHAGGTRQNHISTLKLKTKVRAGGTRQNHSSAAR